MNCLRYGKGGIRLMKIIINAERCKSCGLCIRECPQKAITMTAQMNEKGYHIVTVDDEKCIKCGICHHICPDCVFELLEV